MILMKVYRKLITKGVNEPLQKIPFHGRAPIKRISMLGKKSIPESRTHLAVHFVNASRKKIPEYSKLHKHNHDEINVILSQKGKLVYEIQLEDEIYKVSSPCTVFIPRGMRHRAKAISGSGIFLCMIKSNKYKSSE